MLTVPEAAKRTGRNPETIRRWIRAGRLHSVKVGTQHLIEEADLDALSADDEPLAIPAKLRTTHSGRPMPDFVKLVREARGAH
jgi:excisionase family DNA binding protein